MTKNRKSLIVLSTIAAFLMAGTALAATTDYASSVVSYSPGTVNGGGSIASDRNDPSKALGAPEGTGASGTFVSLGFGGSITLEFPNYVGTNLTITTDETTNGSYPFETADVEVSQDGSTWTSIGPADNNNGAGSNPHQTTLDVPSDMCIKYVRITDTSTAGDFPNGADGFDVDAVEATYDQTCTPPPPPNACEAVDNTLVSDATTQVDGHDATVIDDTMVNPGILPPGAWIGIPDAEWIWSDDGSGADTTVATTKTFTKTFTIAGAVSAGSLDLASDNGYVVTVNGTQVDSKNVDPADEFNYKTVAHYDITSYLHPGTNTLEIAVTNFARPGTTFKNNPGGLIYALSYTDNECTPPPPPCEETCCPTGPVTITVHNTGTVHSTTSGNANTGNNTANGGDGGNGGSGGHSFSFGNFNLPNHSSSGGNGGSGGFGGTIKTGGASALSHTLNKVNISSIRIRR